MEEAMRTKKKWKWNERGEIHTGVVVARPWTSHAIPPRPVGQSTWPRYVHFWLYQSQTHGQPANYSARRCTWHVNSPPFVERMTLDRNSYIDSCIYFPRSYFWFDSLYLFWVTSPRVSRYGIEFECYLYIYYINSDRSNCKNNFFLLFLLKKNF